MFSTVSTSNVNGLKVCYNKSTSSTSNCSTTNNNQPIVLTFSENGLWVITISNSSTSEKLATKYIYIDKNTAVTSSPQPTSSNALSSCVARCVASGVTMDKCIAQCNTSTTPIIKITPVTDSKYAAKIDVSANMSGKIQVSITKSRDVTGKTTTCARFAGGNSRYGQPYDYTAGSAALGIPFDRIGSNKCIATITVNFTASNGTKTSSTYDLEV